VNAVGIPPAPELPGYEHVYSGKVRDLYRAPDGRLLFVASDRISAYDWILPTPIPDKGRILTQLSLWWFERLVDIVPNHLASGAVPAEVAGRAMLCTPLDMLPVECVARGYLAGSAYADYRAGRRVSGHGIPPGLQDGSELPKPLFTPATKAAVGEHDENITYDEMIIAIGQEEAQECKRLTMAIYEKARDLVRGRGLTLADTKLEFGIALSGKHRGRIVLGDEALTPDSSRYWPADQWRPGQAQPSFDKQYVRDWLVNESGWSRDSGDAPPALPDEVVERTRAKYVEAYEIITGEAFA
jgi:phosphoribosylaminoimidazole-succinocarboxamide synthase